MNDVIVTIGRENGSGGREVGMILAGLMGVKCYDRELIEETARKAGVSVDEVMRSEERRAGSLLYFGGIPASNPLFDAQSEAIMDIASKGPCVFVGRCADYVLRNRGGRGQRLHHRSRARPHQTLRREEQHLGEERLREDQEEGR